MTQCEALSIVFTISIPNSSCFCGVRCVFRHLCWGWCVGNVLLTLAALVAYTPPAPATTKAIMRVIEDGGNSSAAVSRRLASKWPKPEWHAPWKL